MKPTIKKIYTALMMVMLYLFLLCFASKFFGVIPRPLDNHFEFLIAATGFNSVALGIGYLLALVYSKLLNAPVKTDNFFAPNPPNYIDKVVEFIIINDIHVERQSSLPTNRDDLAWAEKQGISFWRKEMLILKYLSAYFDIIRSAEKAATALAEANQDKAKVKAS